MKVGAIMHKGVKSVDLDTPVKKIAAQMRKMDVGAITIKANSHLVGIVTDRDIACRAIGNSGDINKMTAKDVMTKSVVCCAADDDVADTIRLMEKKQIRRLPVMDSERGLIGMLSLGDISRKVSKSLSGEVLRAVSAHHA